MRIVNGLKYIGVDYEGSASEYVFKTYSIGGWDLTTTAIKSFAHSLSTAEYKSIIYMNGIILDDSNSYNIPLGGGGTNGWLAGDEPNSVFIWNVGSVNITLACKTSEFSTDHNDGSINRGFVTILYKPD